jgi:ABC-type transporter Mla maintaining outer membrane lipid asymmetry permease subunit MlaE
MCSLMMIVDRNMYEPFKCFNVCFRIIQDILVHLLILIICTTMFIGSMLSAQLHVSAIDVGHHQVVYEYLSISYTNICVFF